MLEAFELDGLAFNVTLSEATATALSGADWVARARLLAGGAVTETTSITLADGVLTVDFGPGALSAGDYDVQVIANPDSEPFTAKAEKFRVRPSLRAPA